jgi:hypothetical protein
MIESTHSPALVEAARTDRNRLHDVWEQLREQRDKLAIELRDVNAAMTDVQASVRRLGEIIGDEMQMPLTRPAQGSSTSTPISGALIRRVAVAVALQDPRAEFPWHYIDWYDAVVEAGYAISGADPQAVFLTQLSRSPMTAKCAKSGCYRLNRRALVDLADQITNLVQAREALLAGGHPSPTNLDAVATRLQQVTNEIGKTERLLAEGLTTAQDLDTNEWFTAPSMPAVGPPTRTSMIRHAVPA